MDEYLQKVLMQQDGLYELTRQNAPEAPETAVIQMAEREETDLTGTEDAPRRDGETDREQAQGMVRLLNETGQAAMRAAAARQAQTAEEQKAMLEHSQERAADLAAAKTAEAVSAMQSAPAAAKAVSRSAEETPFLYAGVRTQETELSMQSVSRFFERDARRYG